MLVVDLHALQAVHVLHFVHDVARELFDTQQAQDVLRIGWAVDDQLALVDHLAFVHQDVAFLGNQLFPDLAFQIGDLQAHLALGFLTVGHGTGHLGQRALVLRRTGFEQFGHTWQTTGNVAGLLAFHRDTGQHFAGAHFLAIAHLQQSADLEADRHRVVGTRNLDFLAVGICQLDLRTHHLGRATVLRIDHHQGGQTGHFVDLLGHRQTFFDILELHLTGVFGNDRAGQRIPVGQHGTCLDLLIRLDRQRCTVRHLVTLTLAAVLVLYHDFAGAGNHDQFALVVGHIAHLWIEAHDTVGLGFHAGGHCRTRRRTTDVERTHGQLRARLTDGLGSDHTDGFAEVDQAATAQVAAVAGGAQTEAGFAGQCRAHLHFVHTSSLQLFDQVFVEQIASLGQQGAGLRVQHFVRSGTAQDTVAQRLDHFTAFDHSAHQRAVVRAAVELGDDQILRHVHQTARQVTRVGRLQRRIRQTLTGTVGGDEVLQHVQTFTEVRRDGGLDDRAVRLGHQTTHTCQLADLCGRATGAGVGHHVNRVERFLIDFLAMAVNDLFLGQLGHHDLGDFVTGLAPDVHHLVVALASGDQTGDVLLLDFLHFRFGAGDDLGLLRWHQHVADGDRDTGARCQTEAVLQQLVGEHHGFLQTALAERDVDQLGDFLLLQRLVDRRERHTLGQNLGQQGAANGGLHQLGRRLELTGGLVLVPLGQTHADLGGALDLLGIQCALHFADVGEHHAFALAVDLLAGGLVQAQHHVLRRNDRGFARSGEQHVVGGQHQGAGFHLCFHRQRHVNSHLVTVEVSVECRANQRVQLQGLAFDQDRLERLDTQTVQRRCAVEHDRMLADHLFQDVPHHGGAGFHFLLGGLDGRGDATRFELREDERLEQLQRHQLGQTALVQLERWAHGNHGTTGVVDALAQQILAETTALALDHVGQRLEGTLVRAGHGLATAAVVQQRVDRFLQHALFIAGNDLWSLQLQQAAQTRVTVDDAAVQVVQVGGRKAAAVQRHQWTQIGRQHRQHFHHHPTGLDAGLLERFEQLQALGVLLDLDFGAGQVVAQALDFRIDLDAFEQVLDAFGAHLGHEFITVLFDVLVVLVFRHDAELLQRGHAGVGHHIGFEVQHAFDVAQGHV